jgi:hypothetical protein
MIYTNFTRHDGSPVSLRWGGWHRNCFLSAYHAESGKYRLPDNGRYTYSRQHLFVDPEDGEVLIINDGDTYSESH